MGALATLGLAVSGCASVIEGRSQQISVNTNPPGAECGLYREEGVRIAAIQKTPGRALIEKTKNDIWIVCVKQGYQQATYLNHSGISGAAFVNVIGGIFTLGISTAIGAAVDSSNGSDNKYESPVNVSMAPNVAGTAEGPAVLPQSFAAARPIQNYSQQVAAPAGVVSTPGEPAAQQAVATERPAATPVPVVAPTVPTGDGAWSSRAVLMADRSVSSCAKDAGAYSLNLTASTLTVDSGEGRVLNAVVPPDGVIDQPLGSSKRGGLNIVGNARSRNLEIVNPVVGCRWKLAPG
jgi:hypothetical protein